MYALYKRRTAICCSQKPQTVQQRHQNHFWSHAKSPTRKELAANIMLAKNWQTERIENWHMSEKFDGVRAIWTGKEFVSRLGNVYFAPDYFVKDFPNVYLDGELYLGRGLFQQTISVVKTGVDIGAKEKKRQLGWDKLQYKVFDCPAQGKKAFETRMEYLRNIVPKDSKHITLTTQELVKSKEHLMEELARVEEQGGEGLMLRRPKSKYHSGRTGDLLKVKSFQDTEAKVMAHVKGKGRHIGSTGAIMVQLGNKDTFKIGTGFTDADRDSPPAIGSIITFRYQGLTDAGLPRFPAYMGPAIDKEWPPAETDLKKVPKTYNASRTASNTSSTKKSRSSSSKSVDSQAVSPSHAQALSTYKASPTRKRVMDRWLEKQKKRQQNPLAL